MRRTNIALTAAMLLAGMAAAHAATVNGRITMLDAKSRQISLDNNEVYSVAPNVDLGAVAVGDRAQLEVNRGTVTAAKKAG